MQKSIRLFWAFVLLQAFWAAAPAHGQLLQCVVNNQVSVVPNSKVWGKTSFKDVTLELHYWNCITGPTSGQPRC
jgi:hypothetical protein